MIPLFASVSPPDWAAAPLVAVLFAAFCWWFGTGALLWLVRRPQAGLARRLIAMSGLLLLSLWAAHASMAERSVGSDYLGFVAVIVMWAWHELAFLSGWLAGPRRQALQPGAQGWPRFLQSVGVLAWHELVLLANFLLLCWLQVGQANHVAICTFGLLWLMRLSAKLNLFIGVPDVGEQFLPLRLAYLGSYFRRGPVGKFYFAAMALAGLSFLWLVQMAQSGAVQANTGWVLLATLLGLAIAEHLLMAFPLPMQKFWAWAMRGHGPLPDHQPSHVVSVPVVVAPLMGDKR